MPVNILSGKILAAQIHDDEYIFELSSRCRIKKPRKTGFN
jgi:hypothetical protein